MPTSFANKLVVITGVGRAGQVGEALARAFADAGATLALLDLQQEEVDARAAALRETGATVSAHAGNLADPVAAMDAARAVHEAHERAFGGRVDAVILAAGGFGSTGPLDESDPAAWHKQFTINLDTAYGATRAFLPAVRKAKGSLVYFGSVASLPGGDPGDLAAYAAAKSGVLTLMTAVARAERKHGVRANAVAPVAVRTQANIDAMGDQDRYVDRESVADVVLFLTSERARNVTGQTLVLS